MKDDMDEVKKIEEKIGYKMMMKERWGGGGRGMREIRDEEDIEREVMEEKREEKEEFGKDEVYIEKMVESERNVEVKILGDK